jgi:predicted amidophosphoribosyltransferase
VLDLLRAWLFPPACVACDAPGPALCADCAPSLRDAIAFDVDGIPAFALGAYDGALRRAIVAMKRGERDPIPALADLLARCAPVEGTLIPVATTRARAAQRGFDQSVQVARRLAACRGVGCAEVLVKRGGPQAGLGRRARLAAAGRFGLRPGSLPGTATLLDDVCTTSATLRDAVSVLRAAAVDVRRIVVIARADGTPGRQMRS